MQILFVIIICLILVVIYLFLRLKQTPLQQHNAKDEPQLPSAEGENPTTRNSEPKDSAPQLTETITTDDTEYHEKDHKKVFLNEELVASLHRVLEEEKVFLRPDIHIDDVARMLLTNRTYVTRMMKQEFGLTFIEYVNVARIQYSQGLLYTSDMTLDEIAEKSGFQSASSYCRAFKRYMGTSPIAWLQDVK